MNYFSHRLTKFFKNLPIDISSIKNTGIINKMMKPYKLNMGKIEYVDKTGGFDDFYKKIKFIYSTGNNLVKKINNFVIEDDLIVVPDQKTNKKTVLIDVANLLVNNNRVRPKIVISDAFLFYLSREYEVITISDEILSDSCLYKKIDPFGCITYKIFLKDYSKLEMAREDYVIITNNPEKFKYENVLCTLSNDLFTTLDLIKNSNNFSGLCKKYKEYDCVEMFKKEGRKRWFDRSNLKSYYECKEKYLRDTFFKGINYSIAKNMALSMIF